MIVTMTPNPAEDLSWHVDRLLPGVTLRVPAGALLGAMIASG